MTQKETQVMHNCAHKFALIFEDDHTLRTTDWESEFDDVEEIFNLKRLPQVCTFFDTIECNPKTSLLYESHICILFKLTVIFFNAYYRSHYQSSINEF